MSDEKFSGLVLWAFNAEPVFSVIFAMNGEFYYAKVVDVHQLLQLRRQESCHTMPVENPCIIL